MPQLIRLTPEIRADFVAYLDGELDEQAAERIETVLAQSNVARKDVEGLAQTYELLDVLPRHEASAEFADKTMATIRFSEWRPDYRETKWFRTLRGSLHVLIWMIALVAVVMAAFLATRRWVPSEADVLVHELPIIERLDTYSEVGGIEFLERLDRQGAMLEEMSRESRSDGGGP